MYDLIISNEFDHVFNKILVICYIDYLCIVQSLHVTFIVKLNLQET